MSVEDERAASHERRMRARRALAEADAAVTRLHEARQRAEELLRRAAGELPEPPDASEGIVAPAPEDALRTRMREIEDRMQATDSRMRTTEAEVNRTGARMSDARSERNR